MSASAMKAMIVLTAACLGGACVPVDPPPDAGAPPPECLGGGAILADVGHTGADFVAIDDGDELPAWTRPQGGIGTRINVSMAGLSDETTFTSLTTQFLGVDGGGSSCDAAEECGELETCDDGTCRVLLANQTNARFPIECLADGTLHVAELPVRFRNQFDLEQLDGVEQELRVTVVPRDAAPLSSSVRVTLRVGEFVEPSWWATGEP